jgi:DNA-binding NtrC family response regulator
LNVLPVKLPPLREHIEDLPLIVNHLLEKHCAQMDMPLKTISTELMDIFVKRHWEGNVRELENVIMQGIIFSSADEIRPEHVELDEKKSTFINNDNALLELPYKEAKENTLLRFNQDYFSRLLTKNKGNVTRAARECGLERQSLQQIMRRYRIKADIYR